MKRRTGFAQPLERKSADEGRLDFPVRDGKRQHPGSVTRRPQPLAAQMAEDKSQDLFFYSGAIAKSDFFGGRANE
jgi:hypothetical protein